MRLRVAQLCESALILLVRTLLPARGRHRATPARRVSAVPHYPPAHSPRPLRVEPLEMDTTLVRPYLHALEVSA